MHLIDIAAGMMGTSAIVCGGIPHAVGAALASQMQGLPYVSIADFGDGAIEEGGFHESMNFASLKRLPVVFVCENNFYAALAPLPDRQPGVEIYRRAETYGMPGVLVDGNDVVEVMTAVGAAVARARQGEGPTLVECRTYRWLEHCGPNDDSSLGYRTSEELQEWTTKCPVRRARGFVSDEEDRALRDRIGREIDEAIAFARNAPFPQPHTGTFA